MYECEIRYQTLLFKASGNDRLEGVMGGFRPVLYHFALSNVLDSKLILEGTPIWRRGYTAIAKRDWTNARSLVKQLVRITVISAMMGL